MSPLPRTATAVFYSYTISANNTEVGSLQSFNPSSTRQVERIRQIMFSTGARVIDMVPGTTDTSISLEHVRLYKKSLFEAFSYQIFALEDLTEPMDIIEEMNHPDGLVDFLVYHQCLFSDWSETRTVGTAHVAGSATVQVAWVSGERQSSAAA